MASASRREAVVLRVGPRRWAQSAVDHAALLLGLALLSTSVVLAGTLPEDDVREPQFRWSFPVESALEANGNQPAFPAMGIYVAEGGTVVVPFDVPHENVFDATIRLFAADDHPATLPDLVEVSLVLPNGTRVLYAGDGLVETAPSIPNPAESTTTVFWIPDAAKAGQVLRFNLGGAPRDALPTLPLGSTVDNAAALAETAHARPQTKGVWELHVRAADFGGCPEPAATSTLSTRAMECRVQTPLDNRPAGAPDTWQPGDPARPDHDAGNPFIVSFDYSFFDIVVEPA